MDTLLQVVSEEPVPPRQLNAKLPADLETVCLKCLHKEPGKRYGSAHELAEDLARFQLGEPIVARPVGRLERAWRWCRRNPALAAALAAVLLVFAAGTTVSTVLAVLAAGARANADEETEKAKQSEATAVSARNDLQTTNDRLLTSVARSSLRPLALQPPQPWQPFPLTDPEIQALWELAASP